MDYVFTDYSVRLSGDAQAAIATIHIIDIEPGKPGFDLGQLILRGRAVEVWPFTSASQGKGGVLQEYTFRKFVDELTDFVSQCAPTMDQFAIMSEYWEAKQRTYRESQRRKEVKRALYAK